MNTPAQAELGRGTPKTYKMVRVRQPPVLQRLQKVPVSDVCISVITKSELLFGVELSPRRRQDESALEAFLRYVEVLDFSDIASMGAGPP